MEKISNNVKITNEKFKYGPQTACTLEFKFNLKEIEKQYFQFTPKFIKNNLSKHIPVVYSVWSFDYSSGVNKCRAKYLVEKYKGTATVLYIDSEYYRRIETVPSIKEKVRLKDIVKPVKRLGEYSDYAYTEKVTVTGVAKVHPSDSFDCAVGEVVSRAKAIKSMARKIKNVYNEIEREASLMAADLHCTTTECLKSICRCDNILKEL